MFAQNADDDKFTENFTGKERDEKIKLNYFGARYLDPMLGMWTSVDPMRQFASPYLYAGNGYNPVNGMDAEGNEFAENDRVINIGQYIYDKLVKVDFFGSEILKNDWNEMKNSDRMITFTLVVLHDELAVLQVALLDCVTIE